MCGENEDNFRGFNYRLGSPPRVRGKPVQCLPETLRKRITPACAGKTLAHLLAGRIKEDHPRVCGENLKKHGNA